jgi:hypothetical protein
LIFDLYSDIAVDKEKSLFHTTKRNRRTSAAWSKATMKIRVRLSIFSERLHPDRVTEVLGMTPDHAVTKGIDRIPPRSVPKAYGWYISCVNESSTELSDVLSDLFCRIQNFPYLISRLRDEDPDLRVMTKFIIYSICNDLPMILDATMVNKFSALNSGIEIEFVDPERDTVNQKQGPNE